MDKFDTRDLEILTERTHLREQRADPLVGDFVDFADGHFERVSHVWPEWLQTTEVGSFHLCGTGNGSFSGGLCPFWIRKDHFRDSGTKRLGEFWFFHPGRWMAHNWVECQAPCRVWNCDYLRRTMHK